MCEGRAAFSAIYKRSLSSISARPAGCTSPLALLPQDQILSQDGKVGGAVSGRHLAGQLTAGGGGWNIPRVMSRLSRTIRQWVIRRSKAKHAPAYAQQRPGALMLSLLLLKLSSVEVCRSLAEATSSWAFSNSGSIEIKFSFVAVT